MATKDEVLDIIATLNIAYGKEIDRQRTELYIRMLADVPAHVLEAAGERAIQTNKWYPTVAELRDHVESVAGTDVPENVPPVDSLAATMLELEQQFYNTGELEVELWNSIADQYTRLGREHRAQFAQEKLRRLQTL